MIAIFSSIGSSKGNQKWVRNLVYRQCILAHWPNGAVMLVGKETSGGILA
jgi:hypothetical protein